MSTAKKIEKFGVQADKGIFITCFRNGDKHHKGETMLINPKRFKKFSQVLEDMTDKVKLVTGPVRQVFTVNGKPVTSLEDFKDGGKYICCSAEPLNKAQMPLVLKNPKKVVEQKEIERIMVQKPVPSPQKQCKEIEKFGVQSKKGIFITVYRNGDKHHKGEKIMVNNKKYKTFDQLKLDLSNRVGLPTGPVRKLVTPEGKVLKHLDELQDGGIYLCCGAEKVNVENCPIRLNM